ncbi:MAG: triple tyrosine motif-containing protein [Sphingopyxis sp.]|nr:triple tyrosine motif-containing protein [Sphingopyxis sp.]
MVDEEGLLWVAGEHGLDRFRRVPLTALATVKNVPTGRFGAYAAYQDGTGEVFLRMGPELFKVSATGDPDLIARAILRTDMPCASPKGGIWARNGTGSFILHGGQNARSLPTPAYLSPGVYSGGCAEDRDGRLWVASDDIALSIVSHDGHREVDLGDQSGYEVTGLASYPPAPLLAYVGNGYLWQQRGDGLAPFWKDVGRRIGFLEFSYKSGRFLYWGGPDGLARSDGRTIQTLSSRDVPFLNRLSGMVQTSRGQTWLLNADGILQLETAKLDMAFETKDVRPEARRFTFDDGLPGKAPYNNASNLVEDRWGRIWVATSAGIAVLDPARLFRNAVPPPMVITSVGADNRVYRARRGLTLPAGTTRVVLRYDGLSLAQPERNRFRHRIAGLDNGWIDNGNQRRAVYSGLGPGTYRFEVAAANNDGVWTDKPSVLEFRIQPLFYQTYWFLAGCILLAGLLLMLFIRLRVRLASERLRARLEVRADEREQISREIHDTLLQSVQGLSLRVHSVADDMRASPKARAALLAALDRADDTIGEARHRIAGLRTPTEGSSLSDLVLRVIDLAKDVDLPVPAVLIEGSERPVDPVVLGELRSVLTEALRNIAWHAKASETRIRLDFGDRELKIVVEDNGAGIPAEIAAGGFREGHFGLKGISERVARCDGRSRIEPREEGGTRLVINLPARTAYVAATTSAFQRVTAFIRGASRSRARGGSPL